jgi:hypothetical protein
MNRDGQRRARLDAGLIAHTDRGSQSPSLACADRPDSPLPTLVRARGASTSGRLAGCGGGAAGAALVDVRQPG